MGEGTSSPRPRRALLGLAALAGGAGSMALEITAVRLLAPWFGTSVQAWTHVIGLVLGALAAGYLLGGRLADRARRPRPGLPLLAGGILTAASPLLLPPLAKAFLDPSLPLEAALGAMAAASLPVSALLFGPAVFLMGMVPPFLVRAWAGGDPARVGRASGTIYALGTLGALAGTFAPTWWLVPALGTKWTLFLAGGLLVLAGGLLELGLFPGGKRGKFLFPGCLLLGGTGFLLPSIPSAPRPWKARVLFQEESPYQFVRVLEKEQEGRTWRFLTLNEGLDSFHSVLGLGVRGNTGGRYYDALTLAPLLCDEPPSRGARVLSLGSAGGTCLRLLEENYGPGLGLEGVEIDPVCVKAGRKFLDLPRRARIHSGVDARVFTRCARGPYRFVVLDAYSSQIYIPFHLATLEFFREIAGLLEPGGVVAVNVADPSGEAVLALPLARTLAKAFQEAVLLAHIPDSRNYILAAKKGGSPDPARFSASSRPGALADLGRLLSKKGEWKLVEPGKGPWFRDDWCPMESLTWKAYRKALEEALQ